MATLNPQFISTANEIPCYRATRNLGVVRGIVVRSRSIIGTIGASLQTLFGGNITLYTSLCEQAREDAFNLMVEQASQRGANAIIAMRYDANEVGPGITEVLAYGTAVVVQPVGVVRLVTAVLAILGFGSLRKLSSSTPLWCCSMRRLSVSLTSSSNFSGQGSPETCFVSI
jgi:uncharacterized protein YbjQ (UPF0145 family)